MIIRKAGKRLRNNLPYILAGVGIGAVIHNWIPGEWIEAALGSGNPFGVVLAVLVGVPMYADIFGTIPVAEALLAKGAQLGTILSFMMAVTTLSFPSMVMLGKAVSRGSWEHLRRSVPWGSFLWVIALICSNICLYKDRRYLSEDTGREKNRGRMQLIWAAPAPCLNGLAFRRYL